MRREEQYTSDKEEILNSPIKTLEELAGVFCCLLECENCPVLIHGYEQRTDNEKKNLHTPCCVNLYKWIVEQAMKQEAS